MSRVKIPLQGGLGNQLFQLAYGCKLKYSHQVQFLYFKYDHKSRSVLEVLKKILNDDLLDCIAVENSYIKWKISNLALRLSVREDKNEIDSTLTNTFRGLANFFFWVTSFGSQNLVHSKSITDINIDIPKQGNFFVSGYFQNREFASYLADEVIFKNRTLPLGEKKILILQIRRGDYESHTKFGVLSDEYFSKNIVQIRNEVNFSEVWIFSNESNTTLNAGLSDFDFRLIRKDSPSSDLSEVFELMRMGDSYLISNSTLGWWAARLAYKKNTKVFYPFPWFKETALGEDFFPREWFPANSLFKN